MERNKRYLMIAVVVLVLTILYGYLAIGYRFDSITAARANHFVGKESKFVDEVRYPWGSVVVLDTPEKPVTALVLKEYVLLWKSNTSTYCYKQEDDLIRTIGLMNFSDDKGRQGMVFTIISNDLNVKYIQIESKQGTIRKGTIFNHPVTLSSPIMINVNDMKPKAYGDGDKLLYEFRYRQENKTDDKELRWYPAKDLL